MPSDSTQRTPEERANEVLGRMTLEEKVHQMTGVLSTTLLGVNGPSPDALSQYLSKGIGHVAGAPALGHQSPSHIARNANALQKFLREGTRLGIPAIIHSEALNGATLPMHPVYPTPIALAATWKPDSIREMATAIGSELRTVGITQALAPVMDVARDSRWGRVHETYGEDPYLVSAMSVAYTEGMQGTSLHRGVIATAKHFLGYAAGEAGQNTAVSVIGDRDLYEVYARPFEAAMRLAGLGSVMNSYSEIDHVPVVGSAAVLRELLRVRLGFTGTVISDYGAVRNLVDIQLTAETAGQAGVQSLRGGLDVELPVAYGYAQGLIDFVSSGAVDIGLIDDAVRRILVDKFALGLFDNPFVNEDAASVGSVVHTADNLAFQLASDSITLLKNQDAALPLPKTLRRVAIIGPHATDTGFAFPSYTYPESVNMMRAMMQGDSANMAGLDAAAEMIGPDVAAALGAAMAPLLTTDPEQFVRDEYGSVSLAEAVAALLPDAEVLSLQTGVLDEEHADLEAAVALAASVDVTILALGGRPGWFGKNITEGEASDTANIDLPKGQVALVKAVAASARQTIGIVFTGRPFALTEVVDDLPALVYAYYGGQRAGQAVAAALFGDVNPGGKLPYSLPRHSGQVPIYVGQHNGSGYRKAASNLNLGYLDMPGTPLFPFGHGLSYSSFEYSELELSASEIHAHDQVVIGLRVRNTSAVTGDEVVQLYFSDRAWAITRPAQELVGFHRVSLPAGKSVRLEFTVRMNQLGYIGHDGRFVLEPGPIGVAVGSSSSDIRLSDSFTVIGDRREMTTFDREFLSSCRVLPME